MGRRLHAVNRIAGFGLALSPPRGSGLLDNQAVLYVCVYAWHDMISLDSSYNTGTLSGTSGSFVNSPCYKEETRPRQVRVSPFGDPISSALILSGKGINGFAVHNSANQHHIGPIIPHLLFSPPAFFQFYPAIVPSTEQYQTNKCF